jgi:hypothetical protein
VWWAKVSSSLKPLILRLKLHRFTDDFAFKLRGPLFVPANSSSLTFFRVYQLTKTFQVIFNIWGLLFTVFGVYHFFDWLECLFAWRDFIFNFTCLSFYVFKGFSKYAAYTWANSDSIGSFLILSLFRAAFCFFTSRFRHFNGSFLFYTK